MFTTNLGTGRKETGSFMLEQMFKKSKQNGNCKPDKRRRIKNDDPASESFSGPWGGFEDEVERSEKQKQEMEARDEQARLLKLAEETAAVPVSVPEATTSVFHGKKMQDWQGRSWMQPAPSVVSRAENDACYLPKKLLHTWKGHSMGVQAIRFFPGTGHLLLSASMDKSIKIWDYFNDRECRMTYQGHAQGVRDIQFAHDGTQFYSTGFDTNVNLWDTETGKIIHSFTNGKISYTIAVHPSNSDSFIVGNQNRMAIQYDAKSGKVVQEYNEHLGTVSSVTFCDEGRKLVTTSDDRKIFVWNYGIPVVDKYISEPHMHAIPAVTVHPSGQYFVGQSMNNTIVTYQASGEFKFQSKKKFYGHANSGYSITPGFSTDGKYLVSGSAEGSVHFWDWKSTKLYRSLKAHDGVAMGSVWHPTQASRVATCGWDSLIKLWD